MINAETLDGLISNAVASMAKFVTDKYANAKTIFELSVFNLTDLRNGTVMLKLLLELSPFISRKHNN